MIDYVIIVQIIALICAGFLGLFIFINNKLTWRIKELEEELKEK